jgi:hypothetical protein
MISISGWHEITLIAHWRFVNIAFGVDIMLLIENLRYTPTERLRRGEQVLASVVSFWEETQRARQIEAGEE